MAVGIGHSRRRPAQPMSWRPASLRELTGLEPLAGLTAYDGARDLQCANPYERISHELLTRLR